MNLTIGFVGGVAGALVVMHYAYKVFYHKAEPVGLTSWFMWTIIDLLLFLTTLQAGKPIWLTFGWFAGAVLTTVALYVRGRWQWSKRETFAAILVAGAVCLWLTQGAMIGVVASSLALTFAGIPILLDMIEDPIRSTFPIWFSTCVADVCTLVDSDWTFAGTFTAWGSLAFCGTMAILSIRKTSTQVQ